MYFVVSVIGCADYMALMKHRYALVQKKKPDLPSFEGLVPKSVEHLATRFDPVNKPNHFMDVRTLLIFGENDKLVPFEASKKFIDAVTDRRHPIVFDVQIEKGVGHEFTDKMLDDVINWLTKNIMSGR